MTTKCKTNIWNKFVWDDVSQLKDHYYYLVTDKRYKTPMKAKWHNDNGGIWEIITGTGKDYIYSWDEKSVLAWMELPECYSE